MGRRACSESASSRRTRRAWKCMPRRVPLSGLNEMLHCGHCVSEPALTECLLVEDTERTCRAHLRKAPLRLRKRHPRPSPGKSSRASATTTPSGTTGASRLCSETRLALGQRPLEVSPQDGEFLSRRNWRAQDVACVLHVETLVANQSVGPAVLPWKYFTRSLLSYDAWSRNPRAKPKAAKLERHLHGWPGQQHLVKEAAVAARS